MRMIRSRMPTLDAALIRFDAWWDRLSHRERVLLSVLGALLALAVLVYGVVKPLQAARAEALADIRTYETYSARIRAAGTLTTARPVRREGSSQKVASDSASALGLTIDAQPVGSGLRVTIADAPYDTIMAWLADLSGTSNLRVRSLALRRAAQPGRVSATVEFGG